MPHTGMIRNPGASAGRAVSSFGSGPALANVPEAARISSWKIQSDDDEGGLLAHREPISTKRTMRNRPAPSDSN